MASPRLSSKPVLTERAAIEALHDFFRDKPFVVFGTGMSCALDPGFGMLALQGELARNVVPEPCSPEQERQWAKVMKSLRNGNGLESALNSVSDSTLLEKVTVATAKFVSSIDREYALKIANEEVIWPATALFKRLVDTVPEGDPILHVLTPNYDTLFEHACDAAGICYTSGYSGGLTRRIDWNAVRRSLLLPHQIRQSGRMKTIYKPRKHARLYKVHGSLNLFRHRDAVVESNAWMWNPPDFASRVIITPGLSKYEALQKYRQELLRFSDAAIESSNRFLFLGYGFNDAHLEGYIEQKLINHACKGIIVTRDSNSRIESLLSKAENLWLVCKMQEEGADGTRIFNKKYAGWLQLPRKRYWDIVTFTTEILKG